MFRVRTWRRVGEALHSISNRRDKMMIGPHVERKTKWRPAFPARRGGLNTAITSGENFLGRCRIFAIFPALLIAICR